MSPNPPARRQVKDKRPAHLAHGRWLGDFEPLSQFERKLVIACARGEVCKPENWDRQRPEADAAAKACARVPYSVGYPIRKLSKPGNCFG